MSAGKSKRSRGKDVPRLDLSKVRRDSSSEESNAEPSKKNLS